MSKIKRAMDLEDDLALDEYIIERRDELLVQSMMFDMDIDWETDKLIEKRQDETPIWVKKWKERESNGDRQPSDYQGWD